MISTHLGLGRNSLSVLLGFLSSLLVGNSGFLDALLVVSHGPFDTTNDIGKGAGSIRTEHFDGLDLSLLGDTKSETSYGTSDVRS